MANLLVYVPTSQPRNPKTETPLAPRSGALDGKRIGLLWNSKVNADVYLRRIRERLEHDFTDLTFEWHAKPTAMKPIPNDTLKQISRCDVIVNAFGDCGSCSSWTVHDGETFERLGIPSVSVISVPFGFKTRVEVKTHGMPSLPIQILPHPIGQLPDEDMREITDAAYAEVVFCLTAAADEVAAAYSEAVSPRSGYSNEG